jgi:excisionase family DNA binding protein
VDEGAQRGGTPSGTPSGNHRANDRDAYYTVNEAAKVLGISERRVRQLAQDEKIAGERTDAGWKLFRCSVHNFRDHKREQTPSREPAGGFTEAREWLDRVCTLERALGRLEGRLELTERAESTVREERDRILEDLKRERERADRLEGVQEEASRLRAELEAERSKGFFRRLFGK